MASILRRIAPVLIARPESTVPSPEPAEPRYPKRKRADVQYNYEDGNTVESDSESELVLVKRPRNTRPLSKHKIFPFMSLPAELRNRIYEECLPEPTQMPESYEGNRVAIWLGFRHRYYRRTIEYIPSIDESEISYRGYYHGRQPRRPTGTMRGGARNQSGNADHSDSEDEEEVDANPKKLGFNILSVCKQIYDEVAPMMYAQHLVFTEVDALFAFAAALSPRTAKLLRSIEIRDWTNTRSRKCRGYNAITMLAAKGVTNLDSLFINSEMGYFYHSWRSQRKDTPVAKKIARKVYRDCHRWLEEMASASGDLYKGVEVLKLNGRMFDCSEELWEDVPGEEKDMYKKELRRLLRAGAL